MRIAPKTVLPITAILSLLSSTAFAQDINLRYGMWHDLQVPVYRTCADMFEAANPGITVTIEQLGWPDYWSSLTTGMITGDAYDVFWNHVSRMPDLAAQGQLLDINPLIERDAVDLSIYTPANLLGQWIFEGQRYGLPKDIGVDGIFYNPGLLEAAGIDPAVMESWTWNPTDGGEFEQIIAQATIDVNGNNALSPDFDIENIAHYGLASASPDQFGQTSWNSFAGSLGFSVQDAPFAGRWNYDDPRFLDTLDWWKRIVAAGYSPSFEELRSGVGTEPLFQGGRAAIIVSGNWVIDSLLQSEFQLGVGQLPSGPEGIRPLANGLADSIYVNTPHPEEAWQLVKFLASPACAEVVGNSGVVIPAQAAAADLVRAFYVDNGIDLSPFTQKPENGDFGPYPIDVKMSEMIGIMLPLIEGYLDDRVTREEFVEGVAEANALYE